MMLSKNILVSFTIILLLIVPSYAFLVTVVPDREGFIVGENPLIELETIFGNEFGQTYTLTRRNSTGDIIDIRTGITSSIINGIVTESFLLNDTALGRNEFNVSGTNLEGGDFINVTNETANLILIPTCSFTTPEILIGKTLGVKCDIQDGEGNPLNDANVIFAFLDSENTPIVEIGNIFKSVVGKAGTSIIVEHMDFSRENTTYILAVGATCGLTNETGCFLGDGTPVLAHQGSASFPFFVSQWLSVQTNVSTTIVKVGDTWQICANVTQQENRTRTHIHVRAEYRLETSTTSSDRILKGQKEEERGIDSNTTETQCIEFLLQDNILIEQGVTNIIASTHVEVVDEQERHLTHYDTTISGITAVTDRIHPEVFWVRTSQYVYSANISTNDFDSGVKDVEAVLNILLTDTNSPATRIKSFTGTFINGTSMPFNLHLSAHRIFEKVDGFVEGVDVISISIMDVPTDEDFEFLITITLEPKEDNNLLPIATAIISLGLLIAGVMMILKNDDEKEGEATGLGTGFFDQLHKQKTMFFSTIFIVAGLLMGAITTQLVLEANGSALPGFTLMLWTSVLTIIFISVFLVWDALRFLIRSAKHNDPWEE